MFKQQRSVGLRLEELESRHPPVDLFFTGALDGFWGTESGGTPATNWDPDQLPAARDTLIFDTTRAGVPNTGNDTPQGSTYSTLIFRGSTGFHVTGNGVNLCGCALGFALRSESDSGVTNTLGIDVTLVDQDGRFVSSQAGSSLHLSESVNLNGFDLTLEGAGDFELEGPLTGTGQVTKTGGGTATLTGSTANSYTGATTVNGGTLILDKPEGTTAIPGNLNILAGLVRFQERDQVSDSSVLTLGAGATLDVDGHAEGLASLAGPASAQVDLGNGTLTLLGGETTEFAGVISGSNGALTVRGSANLTLSGANTYDGFTTVTDQGTLLVNGSLQSVGVNLTGGLLGGGLGNTAGQIRALNASGGTVAPGGLGATGILRAESARLSNTTFVAELNAAGAGVGFDQLDVSGEVELTGASLQLSRAQNFLPQAGSELVILQADTLTGEFEGLTEGTETDINGLPFVISYMADQVSLRAQAVPTSVTLSTPSSITSGDVATLTARVNADVTAAPAGTVTFQAEGTILGSAAVDETGVATLSTTALPEGTTSVTASLEGTGPFQDSISDVRSVEVLTPPTSPPPPPQSSGPFSAEDVPAGQPPIVSVRNADGSVRFEVRAYEQSFTGGVSVALADLTGDGLSDLVTVPGSGGGPLVKAFNGTDGSALFAVLPFEAGFTGGLHLAAADFDGDGQAEIVVGAGELGGPRVSVLGSTGEILANFFAYDMSLRGGVYVAAGDLGSDGAAELVTGPGPGGGPLVKVYEGTGATPLGGFMVADLTDRAGVRVAVGGTNLIQTGPGGEPEVAPTNEFAPSTEGITIT